MTTTASTSIRNKNAHETFLQILDAHYPNIRSDILQGLNIFVMYIKAKVEKARDVRCACETNYCRWWIQFVILNICSKLFDRPLIMSNRAEHWLFDVWLDRQWNEIRYTYIYNWSNVMCYVPYMQMFLISKTESSSFEFMHHYQRLKWSCLANDEKKH